MSASESILANLSRRYVRFALEEARGRSPSYEAFALGVSGDSEVLGFLAALTEGKQQPNLLLAAVRYLLGGFSDWPHLKKALLANADSVRELMLARATQTNEPGRCAVLLPILARLPQPLALIEVGTSAGLCLLADHYGYDYRTAVLHPGEPATGYPIFPCTASDATPLPPTMPRIVWRAGLDLNPIDATDPEQVGWLEALVWPEQTERLARLRAALRIAARQRVNIAQGDLLGDALPALCSAAPTDATLVVFHTAVLAYVPQLKDRQDFAARMASLCPYWISNEATGVFPHLDAIAGPPTTPGRFLMSVNGTPTAWTDPHGSALEWIGNPLPSSS